MRNEINSRYKNKVILNLIQDLRRMLLSFKNSLSGRFQIKCGISPWTSGHALTYTCHAGFTLIELLVVVLIIGILAAVALPQYQKAVDKARYLYASILAKNVWSAQQLYFLDNGVYAQHFADLDIEMPSPMRMQSGNPNDPTEYYFYNWGSCWISPGSSYVACQIKMGSGEYAWYFASYTKKTHECWAEPTTSKRANSLCQMITGKTSSSGHYSF